MRAPRCLPGPRPSVRLTADGTTAVVRPDVGANCVALRIGSRDIIEPSGTVRRVLARPAAAGCPVLFPFPGRVDAARYAFQGVDYTLPATSPDGRGDHVHGLVSRMPWRVRERSASSITCEFASDMLSPDAAAGYPWPFALTVRWSVSPGALRADVAIANTGPTVLPFGFGLHPYLLAMPGDDVVVHASGRWSTATTLDWQPVEQTPWHLRWTDLPIGSPLLLTCSEDQDGDARVGDVSVRWSRASFPDVVVWRPPDRQAVCIEPWSGRLGATSLVPPGEPHGPRILEPGATWSAWMAIALAG